MTRLVWVALRHMMPAIMTVPTDTIRHATIVIRHIVRTANRSAVVRGSSLDYRAPVRLDRQTKRLCQYPCKLIGNQRAARRVASDGPCRQAVSDQRVAPFGCSKRDHELVPERRPGIRRRIPVD